MLGEEWGREGGDGGKEGEGGDGGREGGRDDMRRNVSVIAYHICSIHN